ncbi:hypothetical protein V6N13_122415 [Hibiscus sabdariffa]|uniref:Secreted protein n=1 Tax=Hibiscus sabdariffa TaxID=183260 RepID=A0ABR2Q7S6_9ROSI
MGMFLVAVAKLHLLSSAHSLSPLLGSLICSFVIKLAFSLRIVRGACTDMVAGTRLFLFQLSQIAFGAHGNRPPAPGNSERWQRALRLVSQRVAYATRSQVAQSDEDNFHTLTVLSL